MGFTALNSAAGVRNHFRSGALAPVDGQLRCDGHGDLYFAVIVMLLETCDGFFSSRAIPPSSCHCSRCKFIQFRHAAICRASAVLLTCASWPITMDRISPLSGFFSIPPPLPVTFVTAHLALIFCMWVRTCI